MKNGRIIDVVAGSKLKVTAPDVEVIASTKVKLSTPLVQATQDLQVDGNITAGGTVAATGAVSSAASVADPTGTMQAMRDVFNAHTHPGDRGGTTGTPNQGM